MNTASGDVQIDSAGGGGTIRSASGDVQIGEAAQRVTVQTASGDLHVGSIAEGEVDAKSASGDVRVGIRQGSRLHVDARSLSGDTTSEVELGERRGSGRRPARLGQGGDDERRHPDRPRAGNGRAVGTCALTAS